MNPDSAGTHPTARIYPTTDRPPDIRHILCEPNNLSHKRFSHRQIAGGDKRSRRPESDLPAPLGRSDKSAADAGGLQPIALPRTIDETPIIPEIREQIERARDRIQTFQDRWDQPQIEQFVASDFELVFQTLTWIVEQRLPIGNRMLEWGCGFAVVAALAARLGLDATGIEAEQRLLKEAEQTCRDFDVPVDLVWGNFLPPGAERLSHNPDFPSLGHAVPCGYETIGADLDDFALVFGYPWPGEWVFHERVFARYAAPGALLVLFYGPNDVRAFRKSLVR